MPKKNRNGTSKLKKNQVSKYPSRSFSTGVSTLVGRLDEVLASDSKDQTELARVLGSN